MAETIYQGDTCTIEVTVTDQVTGATVDMDGAAITWVLSKSPGGDALLTKSTSAGGITVGGTGNSVITVTIDAGDTDEFVGGYWHELEVRDSIGQVFTVLQDRVNIKVDTI